MVHKSTEKIRDLALRARYGTESERIEAVNELLQELRSQIEAYRKNDLDEVAPFLSQAIAELGLKMLAEADPVLALETLLGRKQSPEQRAKTTARDRDIARATVGKIDAGMTLENAVADVATAFGQSEAEVRAIYLSGHIEVQAARHQI
jgi:hypothetical protein